MIDEPVPTMPEMVPASRPTVRTKRRFKRSATPQPFADQGGRGSSPPAASLRARKVGRVLRIAPCVMRPGRPLAQRQRAVGGDRQRGLLLDDDQVAGRAAVL